MNQKEKFPYELEIGATMDFVDGKFMMVIKDDSWNDEQIALMRQGVDVHFCYTNDIAIFVVEGGAVDSSDMYFNVQECDEKDDLFARELLDAQVILLNEENEICWKGAATLNKEASAIVKDLLEKQNQVQFMPNEFEVNAEGLQSAYEPFELDKFAKTAFKVK